MRLLSRLLLGLFLISACGVPAQAAQLIAFNSAQTTGTGTTASPTFGTTPVNGDTEVAIITTNSGTTNRVTSITSTGATWSRVAAASAAQTDLNIEVWTAPSVSSAGTAVTVNLASSLTYNVHILEVSGVVGSGVVDIATPGNNTSGSSPVTKTTTSGTLAQPVELLLYAAVCDSTISSNVTLPTGYTSIIGSGSGTGLRLASGYRIYADTVSTETVIGSCGGSPTLNLAQFIIGLKAGQNQLAARNAQTISGNSATGSFTITLPKTPIQGNDVFVATETLTTAGVVTGVTASNINFTRDVIESAAAPGTTIWRGEAQASPGAVITVAGGAVQTIAAAGEFFGVLTSGLDKSTTNSGVSNAPSTGTTGATVQADELVIAGLGVATNQTPGTGAGYTSIANVAASTSALSMAYKIVSSTGTQSMSGSLPAPLTWSGVIATYKQGLASPTLATNHPLLLLGAGS